MLPSTATSTSTSPYWKAFKGKTSTVSQSAITHKYIMICVANSENNSNSHILTDITTENYNI